jgi:hypothetical protein
VLHVWSQRSGSQTISSASAETKRDDTSVFVILLPNHLLSPFFFSPTWQFANTNQAKKKKHDNQASANCRQTKEETPKPR